MSSLLYQALDCENSINVRQTVLYKNVFPDLLKFWSHNFQLNTQLLVAYFNLMLFIQDQLSFI